MNRPAAPLTDTRQLSLKDKRAMGPMDTPVLRYVLVGDAESPHLLKWARGLAAMSQVELHVASSRGFLPAFDAFLPAHRRLALGQQVAHGGGNGAVLKALPMLARWLKALNPDVIHAHYLTSHGTLAVLARLVWRVPGLLVGSAWGSDILVTPRQSRVLAWLTRAVLRRLDLSTSDSHHMALEMQRLGGAAPLVFPFGLEAMPERQGPKVPWHFYANRGLEPIYRPDRVLAVFTAIARLRPEAQLVVANDGSERARLEALAQSWGVSSQVQFTGRLGAAEQAREYGRATYFLSLPASDSVAVSVLESMAHGCWPMLSELPANRELVGEGQGDILPEQTPSAADPRHPGAHPDDWQAWAQAWVMSQDAPEASKRRRAAEQRHRNWVRDHALWQPSLALFMQSVREALGSASASGR
jgi:glycosyltransferase involved in cell wall biosynthesis